MANCIGLSEYHETNLRKLAAYLLALPENYAGFHMAQFECGTVACACGHGPRATGIANLLGDWEVYGRDVFGVDYASDLGVWLFGGSWWRVDNTVRGAGKRILWTLENGAPVANYAAMDEAPLCYANWTPPSVAPEIPVAVLGGPYEGEGAVKRQKQKRVTVSE